MNSKSFFVDENYAQVINDLRMQEYSKASGFELDLAALKWRQADSDSFVMALQMGDTIVATMRGEVIDDPIILEQKLECPWTFPLELKYPVLLLSRAATHSSQRTSGLNLVLRFWFLKFAQHHHIPFVAGTFVSHSPRENTLHAMGYEFFENKLGWQQSSYKSLRPVQIVALDMKNNGQKAIDYCLSKGQESISLYHFHDHMPELKMVRSI